MSGVHLVTAASAAALATARGPHAARRQPRHGTAVHLLRVLLLHRVHHLDLGMRESPVLLLLHSRLLLLLHWIIRSVIRGNLENIDISFKNNYMRTSPICTEHTCEYLKSNTYSFNNYLRWSDYWRGAILLGASRQGPSIVTIRLKVQFDVTFAMITRKNLLRPLTCGGVGGFVVGAGPAGPELAETFPRLPYGEPDAAADMTPGAYWLLPIMPGPYWEPVRDGLFCLGVACWAFIAPGPGNTVGGGGASLTP